MQNHMQNPPDQKVRGQIRGQLRGHFRFLQHTFTWTLSVKAYTGFFRLFYRKIRLNKRFHQKSRVYAGILVKNST